MKAFEVGKEYEACDPGIDTITILKRTEKTLWVKNSTGEWRMRINHDDDGNEFVADSTVPKKWREAFTYNAKWAVI